MAQKTNNENAAAEILNNIGGVYQQKKEYVKALDSYQRSIIYFKKINDDFWISIINRNIGRIFNDLNKPDQALIYFKMNLVYTRKIVDEAREAGVLYDISRQYLKKKDIKEAINSIKLAIEKAERKNQEDILINCYFLYSDILAEKKNYQEALTYLHLYIKKNEMMINKEKNREVARLQEELAAKARLNTIELLEKTNQIEKIRRQILYIGIAVLFIIFAVFIYKFRHLFVFWKKEKYLGGYRLLESIGTGGMGNIFKAHLVRNRSRLVAVKILKDELFQLESNKKRFRREGDIIDKLNHPNILKIHERGEIDDKLYLVMEYIDGITLEKRIERDGRLEINACLHIMIQIAGALASIHAQEIIHRDLKPANIMITRQGNDENFVKLLDFGLSRLKNQSQLTQTGILVGTMNYLAPEQIVSASHSFASDVYSLGVIFYEMLAGHKAFAGETFTDVIRGVLNSTPTEPYSLRPEMPESLNKLIMAMISKEATPRPSVKEVLDSLEKVKI